MQTVIVKRARSPAAPVSPTPTRPVCEAVPSPAFLDAIRARVPSRACATCGDVIGAARLTLHPDASTCAWCAPRGRQASARLASSPEAISTNGPTSCRASVRPATPATRQNLNTRLAM